ncbi:GTPase Era, mitochondrial [Hyperolius riggenbachi]|uniref:GTPase Era, mitochondrial n=1 Tax=Hyperolius riggenbachi TaxID=752182 RepID=UPI0035A337DE
MATMWCAVLRTAGGCCGRALVGRRAARVILVKKCEPQRITTFTACQYSKDSAIGRLLGVGGQSSAEAVLASPAPAVSFNKADQESLLSQAADQPENPRVLKLAIIGAPNAGKSTLSNQLLGRKLFPVSSKVHTTRCQAQGVVTEGDAQLILLDTPGMVNAIKLKRHNLEKSLQQDPWESVKFSDVVLVLVDVSERWMRSSLHWEVLKCLSKYATTPSILVLNKVDLLRDKGSLLDTIHKLTDGVVKGKRAKVKPLVKSAHKSKTADATSLKEDGERIQESSCLPDVTSDVSADLTAEGRSAPLDVKNMAGWPHFHEVFMLSAINGEEVETLKRYLITLAKPGEWLFHSSVVTTQSPQEICDNIIREKLLEYLPQEIPYSITQVTSLWEEGSAGELNIMQTLVVAKKNHMKLLIGPRGERIQQITQEAGRDLMNAFLCDVRLNLTVKYRK